MAKASKRRTTPPSRKAERPDPRKLPTHPPLLPPGERERLAQFREWANSPQGRELRKTARRLALKVDLPQAQPPPSPKRKPKRREKPSEADLQRCVEDMVKEFGDAPPSRDDRWEKVKYRLPTAAYREWLAAEKVHAPQWHHDVRGRPRK